MENSRDEKTGKGRTDELVSLRLGYKATKTVRVVNAREKQDVHRLVRIICFFEKKIDFTGLKKFPRKTVWIVREINAFSLVRRRRDVGRAKYVRPF